MKYIKQYLLALVCAMMVLAGCKDDWDDRTSLIDPSLCDTDLWEEICEQGNLSMFKQILTLTGYAQQMSADYDITVLTVLRRPMMSLKPLSAMARSSRRNFSLILTV